MTNNQKATLKCGYLTVAAGKGGGRLWWHFAGAEFEGRKFGILEFALHGVSESLFLIYSVH